MGRPPVDQRESQPAARVERVAGDSTRSATLPGSMYHESRQFPASWPPFGQSFQGRLSGQSGFDHHGDREQGKVMEMSGFRGGRRRAGRVQATAGRRIGRQAECHLDAQIVQQPGCGEAVAVLGSMSQGRADQCADRTAFRESAASGECRPPAKQRQPSRLLWDSRSEGRGQ